MIENTSEADILHLKHVWAKYWSTQNVQFCNFLKLASDIFNTHGRNIIFPKQILWCLENFNTYVSSAANLVHVEVVLSEKLQIWLCLFFLFVADRGQSKTSIVFLIIKPKTLYCMANFINWERCSTICINLIWIGSRTPENQTRLFLLLESKFFGQNIDIWPTLSSTVNMETTQLPIQIWLFLFIPPGNLSPNKNWRGLKIFHFQLCFTFPENCS